MSHPPAKINPEQEDVMSGETRELQKALSDISNYIYVHDGVLKDRVFSDVVRLIGLKLHSEVSGRTKLLDLRTLSKIDQLEADSWAREVLAFAVREGLENTEDSRWHIKETSLLWAATQLAKFTFKDFPADIKGEAFQALVVNNLRGDRGEYFTPAPIVQAICDAVNPQEGHRVLDPACGSGGFLYGAFRSGVDPNNLFGIELSQDVAEAAKLRIKLLGGKPSQITVGDAFNASRDLFGTFDAVLMNPPFGSRAKITDINLLRSFDLPGIGSTSQSPKPLAPELLFLELALKMLSPGGVMASVVPDGVLQNSSAKYVREWLAREASLQAVISCPSVTFQPYGTGVKTSILIMTKGKSNKSDSTYFGVSGSVGYDARGVSKFRSDVSATGETERALDSDISQISFEVRQHILGKKSTPTFGKIHSGLAPASRWDAEFFADEELALINNLKLKGFRPLSEIADLVTDRFRISDELSEISYLALSDLDARTSQIANVQILHPADLPSRATFAVKRGDVITATSGASTGTKKHVSAIIPDRLSNVIVSNGFAVLRAKTVSNLQLLGLLRSDSFLRQVYRLRTGHAIPSIKDTDLVSVLVPPESDAVWKKWEHLIGKLNEQAESLLAFAEETRNAG
jgi:type I restriction enzyme M protein